MADRSRSRSPDRGVGASDHHHHHHHGGGDGNNDGGHHPHHDDDNDNNDDRRYDADNDGGGDAGGADGADGIKLYVGNLDYGTCYGVCVRAHVYVLLKHVSHVHFPCSFPRPGFNVVFVSHGSCVHLCFPFNSKYKQCISIFPLTHHNRNSHR